MTRTKCPTYRIPRFFELTLLVILLQGMVLADSVQAQNHPMWHDGSLSHLLPGEPPLISAIIESEQTGQISREAAFLAILQFAFDSESHAELHERFAPAEADAPGSPSVLKCLTPYIMAYQDVLEGDSPEHEAIIQYLNPQTYPKTKGENSTGGGLHSVFEEYLSPSGRFLIQYLREGTHAVPLNDTNESGVPDYVEWTAIYADSSWNHLVGRLGFVDPVLPDSVYRIRYESMNVYGYATTTGAFGNTMVVVHNNFNGFPANRDTVDGHQLGALKVTIAHELKHAIQFRTNFWWSRNIEGSAGSFNWSEMDATMTEEVVFSTVKDYLNYLNSTNSIFRGPQSAMPRAYQQATFGLYYRERFGDEFWVNVWSKIGSNHFKPMYDAMDEVLAELNADPREELVNMLLWHYASGALRSRNDFGFNDRTFYPSPILTAPTNPILPFITSNLSKSGKSSRFYEVVPRATDAGSVRIGVFSRMKDVKLGIIGFFKDGTTQTDFILHDTDGFSVGPESTPISFFDGIVPGWHWEDLSRVGVVLVNTGLVSSNAQFIIGSDSNIGYLRFGDVNNSGGTDIYDAEQILQNLTHTPAQVYTSEGFLRADVSGDRTISPYDASLIIKRISGKLTHFPADKDQTGFFPNSDWFRESNPFIASETPVLSRYSIEDISFSWNAVAKNLPDDDTLTVTFTIDQGIGFNSFYTEVRYDTSLIVPVRFVMPGGHGSEIISRNMIFNQGLRLAAASHEEIFTGQFLKIQFLPKADTTVSLRLMRLRLDEDIDETPSIELIEQVKPKEGVGVDPITGIVTQTRLMQNYPNPFNPVTNILYELSEAGRVRLQVYDVTGRLVQTLVNETQSAGTHQVQFNASGLASGVYLVKLEILGMGNDPIQAHIRKVTVLK